MMILQRLVDGLTLQVVLLREFLILVQFLGWGSELRLEEFREIGQTGLDDPNMEQPQKIHLSEEPHETQETSLPGLYPMNDLRVSGRTSGGFRQCLSVFLQKLRQSENGRR